jgi:hypothetical protein
MVLINVARCAMLKFDDNSATIAAIATTSINMATDTPSNSEYEGSDAPIMPVAMDPDAVTTSSLKALESADQRKFIDIVDKLRRNGLSGILELPQLVVCGDQSSGKSSVLEAITEIPFPRKENLCTRFATEVVVSNPT